MSNIVKHAIGIRQTLLDLADRADCEAWRRDRLTNAIRLFAASCPDPAQSRPAHTAKQRRKRT